MRSLFQQSDATALKSTVLRPVGWMMPILVSATLTAFYLGIPNWVGIMFSIFTGLTVLLYLFVYIYCLFTDKDALRSESYSIQKLAIERGFIGDNIIGQIETEITPTSRLIETESVSKPKEQ